jgi:hypothetical protein
MQIEPVKTVHLNNNNLDNWTLKKDYYLELTEQSHTDWFIGKSTISNLTKPYIQIKINWIIGHLIRIIES